MCFMDICIFYSVSLFLSVSHCSLKTGSAHLVPIDRSLLGNTTECKKQACVNSFSTYSEIYWICELRRTVHLQQLRVF
jgi:hypothetical protein